LSIVISNNGPEGMKGCVFGRVWGFRFSESGKKKPHGRMSAQESEKESGTGQRRRGDEIGRGES